MIIFSARSISAHRNPHPHISVTCHNIVRVKSLLAMLTARKVLRPNALSCSGISNSYPISRHSIASTRSSMSLQILIVSIQKVVNLQTGLMLQTPIIRQKICSIELVTLRMMLSRIGMTAAYDSCFRTCSNQSVPTPLIHVFLLGNIAIKGYCD